MAKNGYIICMDANVVFLIAAGSMIAGMMYCVIKATEGDRYDS